MKEASITDPMIKNHLKIEELIKEFKNSTGKNFSLISVNFDKLKWEIEKHFFLEEKAIFTSYNPRRMEDGESIAISGIMQEHKSILEILKKVEDSIENKEKIDISELFDLIIKHKNFEERVLYPRLDKELNKIQKEVIINRISEVFSYEY